MNHIINRFTLDELKEYFNSGDAKKYYDIIIKEETELISRYKDKSRFDYRVTKNLAFYLVETNKYTELLNKIPKQRFNIEEDLPLPSEKIQNLLDEIVKNDLESSIEIILQKYFKNYININTSESVEIYNLKKFNSAFVILSIGKISHLWFVVICAPYSSFAILTSFLIFSSFEKLINLFNSFNLFFSILYIRDKDPEINL